MKNISVIILLAGYSSRMKRGHKALLPFADGKNILEYTIENFKKAGIEEIFLVLGHEEAKIQDFIKENKNIKDCKILVNTHFQKGMFSSVCTGFNALIQHKHIEATFLLPVDAVLIRESTIENILNYWKNLEDKENFSLILPTFLKQCGHPPLIGRKHFKQILAYQTKENEKEFRGLQGYFASFLDKKEREQFFNGYASTNTKDIQFLPLADEGILSDIDNDEEYNKALAFLENTEFRHTASLQEAWHILMHNNLEERTLKHSYKVALASLRICLKLQEKFNNNILYSVTSALLHDICRKEKNHAEVGAEFLTRHGFGNLGKIISVHTDLSQDIIDKLNIYLEKRDIQSILHKNAKEEEIFYASLCVYIADKYYSGSEFVLIEERFNRVIERWQHDIEALQATLERQKITHLVHSFFESELGAEYYHFLEENTNNYYEDILKQLFTLEFIKE